MQEWRKGALCRILLNANKVNPSLILTRGKITRRKWWHSLYGHLPSQNETQKTFLGSHISRIGITETQVPSVIGVPLAARDTPGEPTHTLTLTDYAAGPRGLRRSERKIVDRTRVLSLMVTGRELENDLHHIWLHPPLPMTELVLNKSWKSVGLSTMYWMDEHVISKGSSQVRHR